MAEYHNDSLVCGATSCGNGKSFRYFKWRKSNSQIGKAKVQSYYLRMQKQTTMSNFQWPDSHMNTPCYFPLTIISCHTTGHKGLRHPSKIHASCFKASILLVARSQYLIIRNFWYRSFCNNLLMAQASLLIDSRLGIIWDIWEWSGSEKDLIISSLIRFIIY